MKSFISRLFGRARNSGLIDDILRRWRIGGATQAGIDVTPDSAMRCAAVYACVRVIAESQAQLPLFVYKRRSDGGKERVRDHPVSRLLSQKPNAWQTPFEFREMISGHLSLRGNALVFINKVRDTPFELIPLRPGSTEIEQLPDYSLRYWHTDAKGARKPLPPRSVLHIRGLSSDGINGITPITAYRESVGLSLATEKHQAKSFANGARFRGYLKHPTELSPDAAKRMKEDFDQMHGGDNAYATPLLEDGVDWISAGMNDSDAQTIETRKLARSDIASIFRVPPHMIGDLDRATFSNIEEQNIQFAAAALAPACCRIEQAIARDLLTDKERDEYFVEHTLDGLLRGNTLARYQAYNLAVNGGWMNRNEVRMLENRNPAEGLDEFLTPHSMRDVSNDPDMKPPKEKTDEKSPPARTGNRQPASAAA